MAEDPLIIGEQVAEKVHSSLTGDDATEDTKEEEKSTPEEEAIRAHDEQYWGLITQIADLERLNIELWSAVTRLEDEKLAHEGEYAELAALRTQLASATREAEEVRARNRRLAEEDARHDAEVEDKLRMWRKTCVLLLLVDLACSVRLYLSRTISLSVLLC